ncbi:hypothetical protein B0A48_02831 [Cryoendolithus antarcticus]|uniref:RIC1 C-terminal alpha solenoid region domain-containing protein n=1 Tax=Cryoendolithus antarcticus TaxID=1507870 RepID=A0A1V8TLE3_9PEZI|nr:hypothetical protein B0A48_02831 [Cryoendolithus antarcticus]
MYWPIGSPKAYSLSKDASNAPVTPSEDGGSSTQASDQQGASLSPVETIKRRSDPGSALNGDGPILTNGHSTVKDTVGVDKILAFNSSRSGSLFVTITASSLTAWQTRPTVALATILRSPHSLKTYGSSCSLTLRPDGLIAIVQTQLGYLITYSLSNDANTRVYHTQSANAQYTRNGSAHASEVRLLGLAGLEAAGCEGQGIVEVNVQFRMAIKIDAGITTALALDEDLVVATAQPAAVQSIQWNSQNGRPSTSTELVSRLPWIVEQATIIELVHDRPMSLSTWVTSDGRAYAVRRIAATPKESPGAPTSFRGFCFHEPPSSIEHAVKVAVNARFSLIAVGCSDGTIVCYVVKDYVGNVPVSHRLAPITSSEKSGSITTLLYSPDGYCLFAGYEHGWAMWSVYGKPGGTSFSSDRNVADANEEHWPTGVRNAFWCGGGSELAILDNHGNCIWMLDMARSAAVGCCAPPNIARSMFVSSNSVMMYLGHSVTDLTALTSHASLWQTVQLPSRYLGAQWPIKCAVISADGRYVAVAGRRGLAHYSMISGRWRTFEDPAHENEFTVRGGMCWYQHMLTASVESNGKHQVRLYSREKALDLSHILHTEELSAPVISMTVSGTDSLLVYTYDNELLHYIITPAGSGCKLIQVGQIGFHGVIRAPPRVRTISWLLPEEQLEHGDPSQDVATASVLFLVDGKLVLLQPSTNELGELKYDMRVIAQNVEYFMLMRDQPATAAALAHGASGSRTPTGLNLDQHLGHSLRDSLWYFDGTALHLWHDVQDVLASAPADLGRDLPPIVRIPVDFYPLTALVSKGIMHGIEADLVQRKDIDFSLFRASPRTQLFIPHILRHHLSEYNSPAALHLADSYKKLPYLSHALEVLLHDVLDTEVDQPPDPPETALLPTVVSFLSSFPSYLDIVVNCTRKTELRSWRTLFADLPPVQSLFEQSLTAGKLKTAAGYLLVMHAFSSETFGVHDFARLFVLAGQAQDWELCKELARFLVGIDASGKTLKDALAAADLRGAIAGSTRTPVLPASRSRHTGGNGVGQADYFSLAQRLA